MLNFIFYQYPFSSWINKYLKSAAKSYSQKHDLYLKTSQEIGEFTNEPAELVRNKHKGGFSNDNATVIFEQQETLKKEEVENFYRNFSYYLYELPLWNAERARPYYLWRMMQPFLEKNHYKKILDFGGGAGDLCIELSSRGYEVDYYDISKPLHKFMAWRLSKRSNKGIRMYDDITKINNTYDVVVSFDVLEHLKEIPAALGMLASKIRKAGSFIFSGAFSGGTLHLEENEIYNDFKAIDKLLAENGFRFEKKFAQFYFYKKTH